MKLQTEYHGVLSYGAGKPFAIRFSDEVQRRIRDDPSPFHQRFTLAQSRWDGCELRLNRIHVCGEAILTIECACDDHDFDEEEALDLSTHLEGYLGYDIQTAKRLH
jgi:hypothetical protein